MNLTKSRRKKETEASVAVSTNEHLYTSVEIIATFIHEYLGGKKGVAIHPHGKLYK